VPASAPADVPRIQPTRGQELALAKPLAEAQLHEDPVDGAARQHDSDVAAVVHGLEFVYS